MKMKKKYLDMEDKLFYEKVTAGIFTANVVLNLIIGEIYTAIQLSLCVIVLWMWIYLLK